MNDVLTYEALKAERDAALKAIAAMYEAVTGERPEWSNWHAYLDDIVEEVDAAIAAIRKESHIAGLEAAANRIGVISLKHLPGQKQELIKAIGRDVLRYAAELREAN